MIPSETGIIDLPLRTKEFLSLTRSDETDNSFYMGTPLKSEEAPHTELLQEEEEGQILRAWGWRWGRGTSITRSDSCMSSLWPASVQFLK